MNVLVIGCKLQGTEVIYLAKEAGWHVTAVDHNHDACGACLADTFICCDVNEQDKMLLIFKESDIVIPAIEDENVCSRILQYGEMTDTPVLFDKDAYFISSSKERSNELFEKLGLPLPGKYPECGFPVIVKPDNRSGSEMVECVDNEEQLREYMKKYEGSDQPVIQEYLSGRSFSLEVLRINGKSVYPLVTEVIMDDKYDCKRIVAPAVISDDELNQMYDIAGKLDKALNIEGIFDIEVISDNGKLKLLEIDARVPSQTPISVYHASGFNMIKWLVEQKLFGKTDTAIAKKQVCMYQQISVTPECIRVYGEHIMSERSNLARIKGFFGADEAITDYKDSSKSFCAIVIVCGKTYSEAESRFKKVLDNISSHIGVCNIIE